MAPSREQAGGPELKALPSVEFEVLRALCLTINVAGSAVKDRIFDTLTKDHFSSPFHRAFFAALTVLNEKGEYVVLSNLKDELHNAAMEIPEDFPLADLFRGDPPNPAEVKEWIDRLREPTAGERSFAPGDVAAAPRGPSAPPARAQAARAPAGRAAETTRPSPVPEVRRPGLESEKTPKAGPARTEVAEARPRPAAPAALSSEGEEWTTYLQEVAARQGKVFETGFAGLDETSGGLFAGLMLVVDRDAGRLSGFLKQLTDQIASRSKVPCLYLSFSLPKAALRVRTLARLSGVPARDIERGRIRKGSPEWESVERNGRAAADWLKWIFVVDADPEMEVSQVRDMGQKLLASNGASTCVIVLDSLEQMRMCERSPQSVVGSLKQISESLDALVIAGSANKTLSSESGVDLFAALGDESGAVQLEVIRAEDPRLNTIRFEYRPDIHRFVEQPAS